MARCPVCGVEIPDGEIACPKHKKQVMQEMFDEDESDE